MISSKVLHERQIDNYHVQLCEFDAGGYWINYSCDQTRLLPDPLEYDSNSYLQAKEDFNLICSVIKNILPCERSGRCV